MTVTFRWQALATVIKTEIGVYRRVLKHPHTPRPARWLLRLALAYLLSPLDLIPDWIPLFGQVDDVVLVPLLISVALKLIPAAVLDECRMAAQTASQRHAQTSAIAGYASRSRVSGS